MELTLSEAKTIIFCLYVIPIIFNLHNSIIKGEPLGQYFWPANLIWPISLVWLMFCQTFHIGDDFED